MAVYHQLTRLCILEVGWREHELNLTCFFSCKQDYEIFHKSTLMIYDSPMYEVVFETAAKGWV